MQFFKEQKSKGPLFSKIAPRVDSVNSHWLKVITNSKPCVSRVTNAFHTVYLKVISCCLHAKQQFSFSQICEHIKLNALKAYICKLFFNDQSKAIELEMNIHLPI